MVELYVKSGSTTQTKNMILALLAEATPEKIAEVRIQTMNPERRSLSTTLQEKRCQLSIVLHLDAERPNGITFASAGDVRVVTDEFAHGFTGTGPKDLLEVLRAAGITDSMLPEEIIFRPQHKPLNIYFSARYFSYGTLREVSPQEPNS